MAGSHLICDVFYEMVEELRRWKKIHTIAKEKPCRRLTGTQLTVPRQLQIPSRKIYPTFRFFLALRVKKTERLL